MPDLRPINRVLGLLLIALGAMMTAPALADILTGARGWQSFAIAAVTTALAGVLLSATGTTPPGARISVRQAFLLTSLSWVLICAFSAVPFTWAAGLSYPAAFFEAMSALTTTGGTAIVGLDNQTAGVLLWRALLHAYGGIGIIVVAIAILPLLQIGGMQLFRTESSDKSDKPFPRARQTATTLLLIYAGLNLVSMIGYWLAGMTPFDALCHAFASIATGGMSTHDMSLGFYKSTAVDYVAIASMLAGALPMLLFMHVLRGAPGQLFLNAEVKIFAAIIAAFTAASFCNMIITGISTGEEAFRYSLFNVTTLITTTGFATVDYTNFGPFNDVLLFIVMFLGGCTGSTSGGLKPFRIAVLWGSIIQQLKLAIHPRGVFNVRYGGQTVTDDVISSVYSFLFLYLLTFAIVTAGLQAIGLDFKSAASAAVGNLANVGPGLGPLVGPVGNYATVPEAAYWLLSAAMLIGRLEIFTLLVLVIPRFWRG